MLRILHVFSADFFAGSVAYALQLAEGQRAQGHTVLLASDSDTLPSALPQLRLPVSDRRWRRRLHSVGVLRRVLQTERIDVVHAHSRAASWLAYFATRGQRVPLVSTIHGRQHLHSGRGLFNVYGQRLLAICPNLVTHLVEELGQAPGRVVAVPNGVAFGPLVPAPAAEPLRVAFVGRFNGGKGQRAAGLLQHVFPVLLAEFAGLRLALIGNELAQLPATGQAALATLQSQYGAQIEVVGFTDDVAGWLARTSLTIGAGRVAIEALGAGRPVLALGEASSEGVVTEANFAQAAASNFGDIAARATTPPVAPGTGPLDWPAVLAEARQALAQPAPVPSALVAQVRARYDVAAVAAQVLAVYQAARMAVAVPRHIPVLMYHKIPDAALASKHATYVPKAQFAQHLAWFGQWGLTPITFRDYLAFANGERPLADFPPRPIVLTFDDGYADNHANALPLMQAAGYRGVLYLLGDAQVRYNRWDHDPDPTEPRCELMSAAQRHDFVAAGWEIGAHTQTHPHLTQLPLPEAAAEMAASKQALEAALDVPVLSFAYPYGDLNPALKAAAQAAGFALAVATDSGGLHLEDDRWEIFRVNVFPNETRRSLRKKTSPLYRRYFRWKRGR